MKEKRYTLPEEQPIPVGWHPRLMRKKPWLGLKLLRRNTKGQARLLILMNL